MKKLIFFLFSVISLPCILLSKNPSNGKVIQGQVEFSEEDNTFNINQKSDIAIINWEEFSIDKKKVIRFIMPSEDSVVLNRVVGDKISQFDGLLESNGKVFFINQNGILIESEKQININTSSFLVSTLDIEDDEFINSKVDFKNFSETSSAKIKNYGTISAEKNIILIAREIENNGLVEAAQVSIQAIGSNIYSAAIDQRGIVHAKGGVNEKSRIIISSDSGSVEVTGILKAENPDMKGGIVHVLGEEVKLLTSCKIDASGEYGGGEILIGGDYQGSNPDIKNASCVYMEKGAEIRADALTSGDGGKVIIWGDKTNFFDGTVTARSGKDGGDGGFVEISSKGEINYGRLDVDASSCNGKKGHIFLDPSDITMDDWGVSNPAFPGSSPFTYDPIGAPSPARLYYLDVQNALVAGNDVTLKTTSGTLGSGTVRINKGITWATSATFKVEADRDIYIDEDVVISNTGSGNIDLQANWGQTPSSGNFSGILLDYVTISVVDGNISLKGKGGDSDSSNVGININSGSIIESTGVGDITLIAVGGEGVNSNIGTILRDGSVIRSAMGNISVTSEGGGSGSFNHGLALVVGGAITSTGTGANAAIISIDATGANGSYYNVGLSLEDGSNISTVDGNIGITVTSGNNGNNNCGANINASRINSTGIGSDAGTITINATSAGVSNNIAVELTSGASITTVDGNINVTGTSNGSGDINFGIDLSMISYITSSGTGASAGTITLNGTSGVGNKYNRGINLSLSSKVESIDGDITFNGISRSLNAMAYGNSILSSSQIISTGTGEFAANIYINGTPGSACQYGTWLDRNNGAEITATDGSIVITGGINP